MRWSIIAAVTLTACATTKPDKPENAAMADSDATKLVAELTAEMKPLQIESNRLWFEASISGTDEAFAKSRVAEDALNRFFADPERFAKVKAFRASALSDPLVKRQIDVLYLRMLGKQVEPELLDKITALEKEVEQAFNTYRGTIGKKKVTQNEIEEILRTSKNSKKLRAAWQAQKDVGAMVAPKLNALAKLRNQVATSLGFRDYYALRLAESELEEEKLLALFDELDELTREPFLKAKKDVDARVAKRLGMKPEALMPWHYQNPFFQEPPDVYDTGLDAIYKKQDAVALSKKFFEGLGLEVQEIIERSDLYEKEGKTPHAFAADIDRDGDIRVICNIVPGMQWTQTTVHELGHAVYDKYIDRSLPWLLREAAHPMTTEGFAMMLDRVVANPRFAEALGLITVDRRTEVDPEARAFMTFAPLQFSRWTQVMLRFERQLYRDPDQDLNKLWWDLVEKYQGLQRPKNRNAPDYASKIHLVVAPVYYHNYMMGELFAAQVHEAIADTLNEDAVNSVYVDKPAAGTFMKEKVFAPGSRYPWHELTKRITGKALSPEAFARRF